MKTERVKKVLDLFEVTGRAEKERIIRESPLKDRECQILILRYVNGKSLKECADEIGCEFEALVKAQRKATERIYSYLFPN